MATPITQSKIMLLLACPQTQAEHRYAIGVKVQGGTFAPLVSYPTVEELRENYRDFYRFAKSGNLTLPIAVEKEPSVRWDGSRCATLPDLMNQIAGEFRAEEVTRSIPKRD